MTVCHVTEGVERRVQWDAMTQGGSRGASEGAGSSQPPSPPASELCLVQSVFLRWAILAPLHVRFSSKGRPQPLHLFAAERETQE